MGKKIIILMMVALLLVAGCATSQERKPTAQGDQEQTTNNEAEQIAATEPKVVKVTMKQYEFDPDTIRLKAGEETILELTSLDVPHGFNAPDIGVKTERVDPGQVLRVTAKPEKKGTFTVRCNVYCGEGHKEMTGTIIVE